MDFCWPNCLLLVSLQYYDDKNDDQIPIQVSTEYDDIYSIIITQTFQEI